MVFAFDLDNTLVDMPVVEDCSKELGLNFKTSDVVSWGYKEFPKHLHEAIYRKFADESYMCSLKPFPWSHGVLDAIDASGHSSIIITERNRFLYDATKIYAKKLFPQIRDVLFVDGKLPSLRCNLIDVYIDDNPKYMNEAFSAGIRCYLISNDETKYNWNVEISHGVRRIHSIAGLPEIKGNLK